MKRLAIVSTHPIQYNAPLFQLLAANGAIYVKVFYTWGQSVLENKFDPGFGKNIEWDIPLLEGYEYCFVKNISASPGSHTYKGIDNPTLVKEIQAWGASSVLVYGWNFKSHLACIKFFYKKIPVFFRGDSTLLDPASSIKSVLRKIVLTLVYRRIDIAFYTGTKNKLYFEAFGIQPQQLIFAPHAIQNERFASATAAHLAFISNTRKRFSISADDTVILFAGKLQDKKDPMLLLKAFIQLKCKQTHLLMVGNGEMEAALIAAAEGHPNIHFLPFQNQSMMPAVYRLGQIFCLPSKGPGETWGLAINEAMACGRAIIASSMVGGAVDLIKEGVNGYIFKSGDQAQLTQVLHTMLHDKKKLLHMGQASAHIIKEWTLEKCASAIIGTAKAV